MSKPTFDVHIRNNTTGEVRVYVEDWNDYTDPEDGGINVFMWEEGNYSCDCNRSDWWYRAGGEEGPEQVDCFGRNFTVLKIVRTDQPDGEIYYSETPPTKEKVE